MAKVHVTADKRLAIRCPACKCAHVFDGRWKFNGDFERPTFRDSMRVEMKDNDGNLIEHCHSYVTAGQIQFLEDSLHALAGKTVTLEDW